MCQALFHALKFPVSGEKDSKPSIDAAEPAQTAPAA
jgi:hypothetical protein